MNNHFTDNTVGILIYGQHGLSPPSSSNEIMENNFINNEKNAEAQLWSVNTWNSNYWYDWIGLKFRILRFFPYLISFPPDNIYVLETIFHNIDWKPAKEPYLIPDVGGVD